MLKPRITSAAGFSVVEVVVVIAIMIAVAAMALPSLTSMVKSNQLSLSANDVSNLLTLARSQAIDLRVPVQMRFVTDKWQQSTDDYSSHYRKVSLWKMDLNSTNPDPYIQITKWKTLPDGIIIVPVSGLSSFPQITDASNSYFAGIASDNISGGVTSTGTTFNAGTLTFTPAGGLHSSDSSLSQIYLLLAEGYFPPGATNPVLTGQGKNWAQIRVSTLIGRISSIRP